MEGVINNGICRCCASEGTFKDVKTKYQWMGEEEIYSDMLKDCFDITLSTTANSDEGGICEVCITQLRNAHNFKKQVLHTEEQFRKRLQEQLFQSKVVKIEVSKEADDDESDTNMSDDYALTEYKVDVKQESREESPKPRKRVAKPPAKPTTSKAKKVKVEDGESSKKSVGKQRIKTENQIKQEKDIEPTKSDETRGDTNYSSVSIKKCDSSSSQNTELPKKIYTKLEREKHLNNLDMILTYSNATPIKGHTAFGYACCYCEKKFLQAAELKKHTLEEHNEVAKTKFVKGVHISAYIAKLDITSLKCRICDDAIEGLEDLIEHLANKHEKKLHMDIKNQILPFKFDSHILKCVACEKTFLCFKYLRAHMGLHYKNFVCQFCNASFVNEIGLTNHLKRHTEGEYACNYCPKFFDAKKKKDLHEKFLHKTSFKKNKCPHCPEEFSHYEGKIKHMVAEHGLDPMIWKCLACEKSFDSKPLLNRHIKRIHLLERNYPCSGCDKKFYNADDLKRHMATHTDEKPFQCPVCLKGFGLKNSLRLHMWIHADYKRFKCEHCEQRFVQRCSWRRHMLTQH